LTNRRIVILDVVSKVNVYNDNDLGYYSSNLSTKILTLTAK